MTEETISFIHLNLIKNGNKIQVQMELGLGKYQDPTRNLGYGEAILLNIKTEKISESSNKCSALQNFTSIC